MHSESFHQRPSPRLIYYYTRSGERIRMRLHEPEKRLQIRVPESLVQDLWGSLRFQTRALNTSDKKPIKILHPGFVNRFDGPDFKDAILILEDQHIRGDIEVHVTSQGWYAHKHHLDNKYDGTILHVTLFSDLWTGKLQTNSGVTLPELVLLNYLDAPLRRLLHQFYTRKERTLPCQPFASAIPTAIKKKTVSLMAEYDLKRRIEAIKDMFFKTPDMSEALHQALFRGMGYGPNKQNMATLAHRIPLNVAFQYHTAEQLEALHLGVAGLLQNRLTTKNSSHQATAYLLKLQTLFAHMKEKHSLIVMEGNQWIRARTRPANRATFRIAQLIGWLLPGGLLRHGFKMDFNQSPRGLLYALQNALRTEVSSFWKTHYDFGPHSKRPTPQFGLQRINKLIANVLIPYLILYCEQQGHYWRIELLQNLLSFLPATSDEIIRMFSQISIKPGSAKDCQGLHRLYHSRCEQLGCKACPIGAFILNRL